MTGAFDVPVDPDAPEAREWILRELAGPEYEAARPTLFDRISQAIWEWFTSLRFGGVDGPPVLPLIVVGALVLVALLLAFLIYGLPRVNRRSRADLDLFGVDDERDAATIRRAAADAAAREDWTLASVEGFRALARGLAERTLVTVSPGTTAHGFADRAAGAFPDAADELRWSADLFDAVRYLGRAGDRAGYERVSALDARLSAARPVLPEPTGAPA
ncbi:uncharacterized protein DUF4129 [Diaminobutyricimonas aerilata]|uniref:Uncharacterized protein DUF4129 n=1 Tax=Diaminobutyricimonas aerilata TaxID=1162967 RepID=A0A2M9CH95_9MICO|nr:DUF4129 domain-containing protein [Diaminobutyricimonas aerilata]PJJ71257.1 uncharacterized protein DUF4129 [Diaminobutyricimonas aerilata]